MDMPIIPTSPRPLPPIPAPPPLSGRPVYPIHRPISKPQLWLILIGMLIAIPVLSYLITLTITDGTENYTGAQREAAKIAIQRSKELDFEHTKREYTRARVVKVEPNTSIASYVQKGVNCQNSPDSPDYYQVFVKRYWAIGLDYDSQMERVEVCLARP